MKSDTIKSARAACYRFGGAVKLLALAAVAALSISAQAATKKIGAYTWTYVKVKGGVQIGDGVNVAVSPAPVGTLKIPSKIGSLAVKSIATYAFKDCVEMTSVTVPSGVSDIGMSAFDSCYKLEAASVPSTVKSYGVSVFAHCPMLKKAPLPKNLKVIPEAAFKECLSLTTVTIPSSVTEIAMEAFRMCDSLQAVKVPASVKEIGDYAFANCEQLQAVTIYSKVVGYRMFKDCPALKLAIMRSGVTSIGGEAFVGCSKLEVVALPHSLTSIGTDAFDGALATGRREVRYEMEGDDARCMALLNNSGYSQFNQLSYGLHCRLTVKSNNTKYGAAGIDDDGDFETEMWGYADEDMLALLAKPKKGYYFAGWYFDKACKQPLKGDILSYDEDDYRMKRLFVDMPRKHTTVYARFITKATAKKSLKFTAATKKLAKTAMVGSPEKSVAIKVAASSATLVTLSAKGLPKGLTFDAAAGMIMGAPTVPGTHSITITAKDAAGNKITQKVKISAEVLSWSRGTYYGQARVDSSSVPAIATCTVAKTGKVTGKIYYKGKAYSFTSKCTSSTEESTKFSVKVKIGSKTFSTGTVATFKAGTEFPVVCAESAGNTFIVQKHPGLIKAGGALEKYIGKVFAVTGSFEDSASWGLKKSSDKLTFKVVSGDLVQVSGTVNGAKIAIAAPLRLIYNTLDRSSDAGVIKEIDEGVEYTTYRLYADLVALNGKYFHPLVIEVTVDPAGDIQLEGWR